MSKKDLAAKEFFNRPEIIADLCNAFIFSGERAVSPTDVHFVPTESTGGPLDKGNRKHPPSGSRRRDSLCMISYSHNDRKQFMLLGLEFQSRRGGELVIRVMDYDGRTLSEMVDKMKSGSAVVPVLTLVINLSGRPWRCARSLAEYFRGADERLLMHMDFRVLVVDPYTMDQKIIDGMFTELKIVINCFRYSMDRRKLDEILSGIQDGALSREAVHLLNIYLELGLEIPEEEKEEIHMCKAVREWKKELRDEGRAEGRVEGRAEGRVEGLAEGLEKGLEKGRAEGRENIILAMLSRKAAPSLIHQLTGIPLKQILNIAEANLIPV